MKTPIKEGDSVIYEGKIRIVKDVVFVCPCPKSCVKHNPKKGCLFVLVLDDGSKVLSSDVQRINHKK